MHWIFVFGCQCTRFQTTYCTALVRLSLGLPTVPSFCQTTKLMEVQSCCFWLKTCKLSQTKHLGLHWQCPRGTRTLCQTPPTATSDLNINEQSTLHWKTCRTTSQVVKTERAKFAQSRGLCVVSDIVAFKAPDGEQWRGWHREPVLRGQLKLAFTAHKPPPSQPDRRPPASPWWKSIISHDKYERERERDSQTEGAQLTKQYFCVIQSGKSRMRNEWKYM